MNNLDEQAIEMAMKCRWDEAIATNKQILSDEPDNIDALNRLSRAYFETNQGDKATKTSKMVLQIDPTNTIALKAIEKYKRIKSNSIKTTSLTAYDFLEEPGKTKVVSLLNLAKPEITSCLDSGDEVELLSHSHRISVVTKEQTYIGRLPDDISARLKVFIKAGNGYKSFIKSSNKSEVKVFIKETLRVEKYKHTPTFTKEKLESVGEI